jgi:hypothetical protein
MSAVGHKIYPVVNIATIHSVASLSRLSRRIYIASATVIFYRVSNILLRNGSPSPCHNRSIAIAYWVPHPTITIMSSWIYIVHRRILHVRVAIETLRPLRLRHNRIRADEPPNPRQVIPGVHVDQSDIIRPGVVLPVPGEASIRDVGIDARDGFRPVAAVRFVAGRAVGDMV